MPSISIKLDPQKFAPGVSVGVYAPPAGWSSNRASGPPPGSLLDTQVVTSAGAVFSNLQYGVEYTAYAGAPDRYWQFEASGTTLSIYDRVAANTAAIAALALGSGGGPLSINVQAAASYTFVLTDGNGTTLVEFTNASAIAATIPPNASVAYPVGSALFISQGGGGQVTITAGAGVTLRVPNGAKTAQQWSQATMVQRAVNDWIVSGDTTL